MAASQLSFRKVRDIPGMNSQGILIWANGSKYIGYWKVGERGDQTKRKSFLHISGTAAEPSSFGR